tara:strand:+ start:67114 stop:68463 length:1350 start_codon:yes stop_codon:yes gene_type:complete
MPSPHLQSFYRHALQGLLIAAVLGLCAATSLAQGVTILEHSPTEKHPTLGPADAPVTLEFFLDVGSTNSRRAHLLVREFVKQHPKRLRVVYRLTEKNSSGERSASLAQNFAQEAFAQGRFFEFMDVYFASDSSSIPRPDSYPAVARIAGVNYKRVQQALESMQHEPALKENFYYWRRTLVNEVPGFRFNGRNAKRVSSVALLEELYDSALRDSLALEYSGVARKDIADRLAALQQERRYAGKRFSGPIDDSNFEPPSKPTAVSMAALAIGPLVQGPDDAKTTIVFLCHFQSTQCRTMKGYIDLILKAYPDEVRLVFRPLFDTTVLTQDKALLMHQAALCADEQGAFWDFYQHAFDYQRRINFDQSLAVELASSAVLDLDVAKFESCLESGRHLEAVDNEVAEILKAGVRHTPALVVDGVAYWGRLHFTDIRVLLNRALRPGLLERLGSR